MSSDFLAAVQKRLSGLVKDRRINRPPPLRSIKDVGMAWARRVRIGDDIGPMLPRTAANVRPAGEPYRKYSMADVCQEEGKKGFTVLSLFAGAGGSCLGYMLAGGEVRAVVEINPAAARTYRRNHPSCIIEQRDIREVLSEQGGLDRLLRKACLRPGELDWLDASPPCIEFSLGGGGIGDQTRVKVHGGVQQTHIASLPLDYVKFLHLTMAKVSSMENVLGMQIQSPAFLRRIVRDLRFDGERRLYYSNWRVLSAADFGVAQNRERIIVISVRKDVAERVGIRSDEDVLDVFPRPCSGWVSIRSALEDLKQDFEDERPYLISIRASRLPGLLRCLPKCPPKTRRLKNVKTNFTLARCSWDTPAPTLVVAGQKPDGLSGAIHPEVDRKFTVPELKRLFGLPDDFILIGTIDQAVECICNMVPPLLTKAVAESVYERVLKPSRELVGG
jgi:DNA (cytosine-5)-methyltransferase 1